MHDKFGFKRKIISRMISSRLIILSFSALLSCSTFLGAGEKKQEAETVSFDDLKSIVETLASDEFEGREADTRGGKLTSMFISSWISAADLPNFVQPIPCLAADVDYSNSSLSLKKSDRDVKKIYPLETEVYYAPQSAESFSMSAPCVFAGYGIDAPEYSYTDYGAFDVKGKIVIVFNHEPQEKDEKSIFKGAKTTRYSMPQVKAQIAKDKGALAIIIMRDRNNSHKSMSETLAQKGRKEERGHFLGLESESHPIPIFYLEDPVADEIFQKSGIDLRKKQAEIDETLRSEPIDLKDVKLTLIAIMKDKKKVVLKNIISKIEGSDSKLKDEAVIVGAHYDHLGAKQEGIYHGADDNASGTAALLNLAKAFNRNQVKPKRSIYFVFFDAEEKGVIGSKYFSSNLPVTKEKVSAMLNLDELGRNNMDKEENANMAIAFMSGQSPALKEIVKKCNASIGLDMKYYPTLKFLMNSDHSLFHEMKIPVIFFYSGYHDDYHKTTDTADKLNYPKLKKLTRLIYLTIWDIANREEKVPFDTSITQEPEKDEFEKPY